MALWESARHSARSPYSHSWLAGIVVALDTLLRRYQAVEEYTAHPACIFRLSITRARRRLTLRDGTRVWPGQRVAQLHFWNEHVPPFPSRGATICWAREMQRSITTSLRELECHLSSRPDLRDISVICGDVPCGTKSQIRQIAHIMAYYGFETMLERERLSIGERIHRFGENVLISLTVFARNAGALRLDTLNRVRVPIFISRRILERKFGDASLVVGGAWGGL
jgi:hypothetical protein